MKVKQFYNKNQFVIEGGETVIFQSYQSEIAIYKNGVLMLGRDWNYSNTTRKHLYLFLKKYCYNIYIELDDKNKRKSIEKLIQQGKIIYNDLLF